MSSTSNIGCAVVAVDGSEESMYALRWALDNVKLRSPHAESSESPGSFIVLHVQSPPSISVGLNPGAIPFGGPALSRLLELLDLADLEVPAFTAAIEAHQKRITEAIFDHALEICRKQNVIAVKTQVVIGDPKEKICETVSSLHADLLVMGSRDFGPIKRMFLGSVSNYCANHVQCPVIIIKGKGKVEESP